MTLLMQAMDIDGLLASTATIDQGGVRTLTDRGELVYDLAALTEALRLRRGLQTRAGDESIRVRAQYLCWMLRMSAAALRSSRR